MATVAGSRLGSERRFYSGMALFMIAIVFLGFAQSFYLRGLVNISPRPNPTLPPLVLIHGLVFTGWMLLFLTQALLVAANRRDIHRQLGVLGMALALVMLPMIYAIGVGQVARANQPAGITALAWTSLPLSAIPPFAILVGLGWRYRREAQTHKRLMLGAALLMMHPAIGRFPIAPPTPAGVGILALLAALCFVPLLLWDRKWLGHVHWASKLGFGLSLGAGVFYTAMLMTGWWDPIAARLPGV
jgi:hypothetical protein